MKKLAVLFLIAALSPAAMAASRVKVEEVEQVLISSHGEKDAKVAEKIAGLHLMERASTAWVLKWQKESPGKETSEALVGLADEAAFLDLPSAEIPSIDKPDPEGRRQILLRAVEYVKTTIHQLPNFSAVRKTTHFDDMSMAEEALELASANHEEEWDTSAQPQSLATATPEPMHLRSSTSILVTYRDGREVLDSPRERRLTAEKHGFGFTTSGEFGPILTVVLGDALRGEVFWDHWEQGAKSPVAVFRYTVPREMSHYTVISQADAKPMMPAYHGEIGVDPVTGAIQRISVVSTPDSRDSSENSIVVEYGSVAIGSVNYVVPIKGVALCRMSASAARQSINPYVNLAAEAYRIPTLTYLNDISFTDYHVFRTEMHVLP